MRHAHSLVAFAAVAPLALLAAACSGSGSSIANPNPGSTVSIGGESVAMAESNLPRATTASVSSSALSDAVAANNAFAVDLYTQLRAANASPANLLSSPLSASLALTMTYAGAQGTTASQMTTALHLVSSPASAASTIFEGQNALSQALASRAAAALAADTKNAQETGGTAPSPTNYALTVVNSVWGEQTYTWNTPFLDVLAQDYGTGVFLEDFVHDYDPARVLINGWVSTETSGKIQNLLPEGSLDPDTRLVLVNAIHLKLPWASPFTPSATAPATFTTEAGTTVSTPFMNQIATFPYTDDGKAQIIGLPLANSQVEVVLALPHGDLADYEAGLTATSAGITVPAGQTMVALSVPKVTFGSPTFSLASALKTMGMPIAFDPVSADFKGMCTHPPDGDNLYISDVLQQATIAMQETGVEAAAATAVIVEGFAEISPAPQPVSMVVNRPYVLSIIDVPTGALLFLGHIVDPAQGGQGGQGN